MGNNYMNQPQRAYGGMRYSGRVGRYTGCRSDQMETMSGQCGCMETVSARRSGEDTCPCDCVSPADGIVACPGQVVAMAYVPMQQWGDLYDAERALCRGTLFRDLDKPLTGGRGV